MEKPQQNNKENKEVKIPYTKKASACSTQITDGMNTSREQSRTRAVNNQRANLLKVELNNRLQNARLNTEEKRSKGAAKEFGGKSIDMARTMPVLKMSDFKLQKEVKITEVAEERLEREEIKLVLSEVFEVPGEVEKGRGKIMSPRAKINLKVVTNR